MTQLREVVLTNNRIEFLPKDVFRDLPKLEKLGLGGIQIKKLPVELLKSLRKLKNIDFSRNKIELLPQNLFADNLELEYISAHSSS